MGGSQPGPHVAHARLVHGCLRHGDILTHRGDGRCSYDVGVETLKADVVQDIRFARSADGVGIAYAVHGSGPPLLIDACWLSHLQFDWESPVWRHYLVELGKIATVIRYDERGHGLSDRGVTDHSLEARVADLEAVVRGCRTGPVRAHGHGAGRPGRDRVCRAASRTTHPPHRSTEATRARTPARRPEELELLAAFEALIRVGWARPTSEFRRVFSSMMIPGGTEEQMRWLDDLQQRACDTETAVISRSQRQISDSTWRLPELDLPTLVIHSRGDQMNEFHHARDLAAGIRGARLVGLDSSNHIVLADEPAWPVFMREITDFIEPDRQRAPTAIADDVAALDLAAGARHPAARRRGVRQRRHRGRAVPLRAHGRATPAERLREARAERTDGPHRRRRTAAVPRVAPTRQPPRALRPDAFVARRRRCERGVRDSYRGDINHNRRNPDVILYQHHLHRHGDRGGPRTQGEARGDVGQRKLPHGRRRGRPHARRHPRRGDRCPARTARPRRRRRHRHVGYPVGPARRRGHRHGSHARTPRRRPRSRRGGGDRADVADRGCRSPAVQRRGLRRRHVEHRRDVRTAPRAGGGRARPGVPSRRNDRRPQLDPERLHRAALRDDEALRAAAPSRCFPCTALGQRRARPGPVRRPRRGASSPTSRCCGSTDSPTGRSSATS